MSFFFLFFLLKKYFNLKKNLCFVSEICPFLKKIIYFLNYVKIILWGGKLALAAEVSVDAAVVGYSFFRGMSFRLVLGTSWNCLFFMLKRV